MSSSAHRSPLFFTLLALLADTILCEEPSVNLRSARIVLDITSRKMADRPIIEGIHFDRKIRIAREAEIWISWLETTGRPMQHLTETRSNFPAAERRRYLLAVAARDAELDGVFVYAVRSTGIYCRPSCPSRRPHPRHVVLFAAPEGAELAGFRSCRRCRPHLAVRSRQSELVCKVCEAITADANAGTNLERLKATTGLSAHHLQRTFRKAMGVTPRQYADALRARHLKTDLRKGTDVTTAMYEAGYGSASRLYEQSNAQLGMTPAVYGRGGRGMKISYTISGCTLGRVLVARTERGVAAISLGDDDSRLVSALHREYPRAEIRRGSGEMTRCVRAIVRHLAGSQPRFDLPTDVVATAFQRRVWEALRSIPSGTTLSYGELARALGWPGATRAVARACATNPTAILVPCHRVIRSDGSLGGYRWGLERKKTLLDRERRGAKMN